MPSAPTPTPNHSTPNPAIAHPVSVEELEQMKQQMTALLYPVDVLKFIFSELINEFKVEAVEVRV